jgi:peptidoglycan/LPS O-acetylase OafA/YrhL
VTGGPRRRQHFPALDGLRAVAVLTVVLFHAGVSHAQGGFLGVSLFFTLSGFLITGLLLAEHASTGRIALRSFWARRVRRLAPASLLCLAAILISAPWLVAASEMRTMRGDVIAAAANIANWRFLTAGQSYASLFTGRPSPVLHFWSLAIEEQFYLVFPVLVACLLRFRRRTVLPLVLAGLIGLSLASALRSSNHDLVYYGTHTRAAELLIGALLACAVWQPHRRVARWLEAHTRTLSALAIAAIAAAAVLVMTTPQSAGWLYRGGFPAMALLWCPMIVAATNNTAYSAVLGSSPLSAIGRRSYGIYVFHWPVFTLATPHVLHLSGWTARAVQLAIIGVATEISFQLVEQPIRERRILRNGAMMRVTALTAVAGVMVAAVIVPAHPTPAAARISMLDAPDVPVLMVSQPAAVPPVGDRPLPPPGAATQPGTTPVTSRPAAVTAASAIDAPPALRVVVIGSTPAVVAAVRSAVAGTSGVDVIDGVRPNCPAILVGPMLPPSLGCASAPQPSGDLTVVALGESDHDAFAERVAASRQQGVDELYSVTQALDQAGVAAFVAASHAHSSFVVVDADQRPRPGRDFLDTVLAEASVSSTDLTVVTVAQVDAALASKLAGLRPTQASAPRPGSQKLRVMVIGDSTSYGVARGLADSGQPVDVLWAGKRNCPLIPMEAITLIGKEYSMAGCPTVQKGWPEALASFRPDVVLAVDSLPEESLQRYAGDSTWYAPGDQEFIDQHNAGMHDLLALLAPTGAVLEIADAPFNAPDAPAEWSTDEHISAWNGQLVSWDAQWSVVEGIGYAGLIKRAEVAAGHTLRPDGAHLDDASVGEIIGGQFAPLLVQQATALRAAMLARGCIVDGSAGPSLNLRWCH